MRIVISEGQRPGYCNHNENDRRLSESERANGRAVGPLDNIFIVSPVRWTGLCNLLDLWSIAEIANPLLCGEQQGANRPFYKLVTSATVRPFSQSSTNAPSCPCNSLHAGRLRQSNTSVAMGRQTCDVDTFFAMSVFCGVAIVERLPTCQL